MVQDYEHCLLGVEVGVGLVSSTAHYRVTQTGSRIDEVVYLPFLNQKEICL